MSPLIFLNFYPPTIVPIQSIQNGRELRSLYPKWGTQELKVSQPNDIIITRMSNLLLWPLCLLSIDMLHEPVELLISCQLDTLLSTAKGRDQVRIEQEKRLRKQARKQDRGRRHRGRRGFEHQMIHINQMIHDQMIFDHWFHVKSQTRTPANWSAWLDSALALPRRLIEAIEAVKA